MRSRTFQSRTAKAPMTPKTAPGAHGHAVLLREQERVDQRGDDPGEHVKTSEGDPSPTVLQEGSHREKEQHVPEQMEPVHVQEHVGQEGDRRDSVR